MDDLVDVGFALRACNPLGADSAGSAKRALREHGLSDCRHPEA